MYIHIIICCIFGYSNLPVNKLALAIPGPFDYCNGISYINGFDKYESLYGVNVKKFLANELDLKADHIVFKNDAEAFLQGEVISGCARRYEKVIGFTLGTGMGSAKSVNGVTTGLDWGGLPYGESIADDYFSARWFLNAYQKASNIRCGNVKELAESVNIDSKAAHVFEEFAQNFASFISDQIKEYRPDCIVIEAILLKLIICL